MSEDPELKAMAAVTTAFEGLDERTLNRVLKWARDRFSTLPEREAETAPAASVTTGSDLASMYEAAAPRTDPERALVVGYWFQVEQGLKDFDSQRINTELKNFGHGVGNITDALSRLISRKPQWVIQTRKSGSTRQARKQYRLTNEGLKRVKEMLAGTNREAAD